MKKPAPHFYLGSLLAFVLSGCASADGRYPSLAVRDAERVTGDFTPIAPAQTTIEDIVSPQRVADLVSSANDFQRKFAQARPNAERLARMAQGAGVESDRRAQALVAVAEMTSFRGQTALVVARFDALEAEALTTFAPLETIESGQEYTSRLLREQDEVLDSLSQMLAR